MDLCRGDGGVVSKGSWCKSDGDFDSATTFWEVQPRGPSCLPARSLLPGGGRYAADATLEAKATSWGHVSSRLSQRRNWSQIRDWCDGRVELSGSGGESDI